jgi:hypothetical protein
MGRGIVVYPRFHLMLKELPQNNIPEEGMDPCPKFQGPAMCAPCTGIVPCAGVDCPKMGFPPDGDAADEKVLLPNVSFQENGVEPTVILFTGGP